MVQGMKYGISLVVGLPLGFVVNDVTAGIIANAIVSIATVWVVEYYKTKRSRKNGKT